MEWVILIFMAFFVFVALFGFYNYLKNKRNRIDNPQSNKTPLNQTSAEIEPAVETQITRLDSQQQEIYELSNELTIKQAKDKVNQYPLPTAWYKFYVYFRFPVGFLVSLYSLWQVISFYSEYTWIEMPAIQGFAVFLEIAYLIFGIIVFALTLKLNQRAYECNIGYLIVTVGYWALISVLQAGMDVPNMQFITYLLSFTIAAIIYGLVWFLPNFIYFRKRKSLFHPEFDPNKQAKKKAYKPSDKNSFEYNAKMYERKDFIKLMTQEICNQLNEEKIIEQIERLKEEYPKSQNPQRCQAIIEAHSIAYQLKQNRLFTFDEIYNKMH
ncbi:MAG: hypothetical protein U0I48_03435 [Acutalibacteraceae bacterium]|nr:hypothetical protein [Acutalibacteraceae bacterium]